MKEHDDSVRKSNIRLALILGAVALLLAAWPLYMLRGGLGS
jgi:hypothetical protein